jgi:hypothetical protein
MTHILVGDPALEELRRQLRDGEITYPQYKAALRTLPEPDERVCDTPGCNRTAHSVQRGRALCAVCGLTDRNARR